MAGTTKHAHASEARPKRIEQGVLADPGAGFAGDEVGYGGPQVCKIVGITYRQLDYWARTDLAAAVARRRAGQRHASGATRTATSSR